MAWTTQYFHEFSDANGIPCRVDILKDAAALDIELEGQPNPFKIIYPGIKNKLDSVRGSGCEVNLFSATDRQLLELFTADIQEYRIKYTVASAVTWFGYLDSEQYSEDYSSLTDYPVQFTGSCLGVLDRIKFLNSGVPFTGLMSQWVVLQYIFTKWGLLTYINAIKIKIATDSTHITIGATETIFHKTYVNCANYYDEDGEPMTHREVLESILAPYGAFLTIVGDEILITDLHTLATDSGFTWKVFTNAFIYSTTEASETIPDIEDLGYYETGANLDIVAGINRQIVKYSPYAVDKIEQSIQNVEDMTFSSGTEPDFQNINGGPSQRADNISGLLGWTFYGATNPDRLVGSRENSDAEAEYYLRIINPNYDVETVDHTTPPTQTHSKYTWDLPHIIGSTPHYLKITGEIRALATDDPYEESSWAIYHVGIAVRLWIGTKSFDAANRTWDTSTHWFHIMGGNYEGNNMNAWCEFKTTQSAGGSISDTSEYPMNDEGVLIGIGSGQQGKIKLEFTYYVTGWAIPFGKAGWNSPTDSQIKLIKTCEIKNIKIELVKRPEMIEAGTDDIEYIGELNESWKDEGQSLTLIHGCSYVGTPFDRGGLIYDYGVGDYRFFESWVRNSITETLEKLLLNTIQSNYETETTKLKVNINNINHMPFLRIEDDTYLSGQILMFAGGTIDCVNNSIECTLLEIKPDSLTIA